jgi:glycosyltransferase involved in cell wall biosynthesis
MKQAFVVPDLHGPATGGTLYNRRLIEALEAQGGAPAVMSAARALPVIGRHPPRVYWVDTLFLDAFTTLADAAYKGSAVGLLMHYLPTLVTAGEKPGLEALSSVERTALIRARWLLVPSPYLADELQALDVPEHRIIVVEPGVDVRPPADSTTSRSTRRTSVHAVIVANLVEGKGVLPFLRALDRAMHSSDTLHVKVIGSLQMQPAHAGACALLVSRSSRLRTRVELLGSCSPDVCIETLAQADVLISASRMESYGMALAEARALGLPIVARSGGNAAAHVAPESGGQLLADDTALAEACLALSRDPAELALRKRRARSRACARGWDLAAREFVDRTARLGAEP